MIAVAVVEDHPVFRQGLAQVLRSASDLALCAMAPSVEELDEHAGVSPDVVLLDLHLPGRCGDDAVSHVSSTGTAVLVISAAATSADVLGAIEAGARGYLTKGADSTEILAAIRTVADGATYVSPTLASYMLDASAGAAPGGLELTRRETQVLALLASGERDQDIAEALFVSVRTVRSHLDHIRDKTGRRRRSDLTRLAMQRGIVDEERD